MFYNMTSNTNIKQVSTDSKAKLRLDMGTSAHSQIYLSKASPRRYRLLLQEMQNPEGGDIRESDTIPIFFFLLKKDKKK